MTAEDFVALYDLLDKWQKTFEEDLQHPANREEEDNDG